MIWFGPIDRITRTLSWPPAAFVGKISYGIYLYHMICQYVVWEVLTRNIEDWNRFAKFGIRLSLFVGLSIGVASISYFLIERPFLRAKQRFR